MKLYAPGYYKDFECIAGKCEHSCCIGWEIDIDEKTMSKYDNLHIGYGSTIRESIRLNDTPHFKLTSDKRCPHLNSDGLCNIIINIGEDYLCDICREHPRFYNFSDVAEVGIGMSCVEAARVILSSPFYNEFVEIVDISYEEEYYDFDSRSERNSVYEILSDDKVDYSVRLMKICDKYGIESSNDKLWLQIIDSLEYLHNEHKNLFMKYSSEKRADGKDEFLERALAYFIYRHCTEAFDIGDFSHRLSFCLFCERLLASLIFESGSDSLKDIASLASIVSEEIEYSDNNTFALIYK